MTTVTVNGATKEDLDSLLASVAGLFAEDAGHHDALRDVDWPAREGAAYYSGLIEDQACLVVLARDQDQVLGHLIGKLNGPDAMWTARLAVLESMRVAPGSRQAGVGSLLVQHFFGWAREHGAQQASVTAFAANDTAQRFYARHGVVPQSVTSRTVL